jgi:hypothetical protein
MGLAQANEAGSHFDQGVSVLDDIRYVEPGVGYFPLLGEAQSLHGFTWGPTSENMAYRLHDPDADPHDITRRNNDFLRSLGMMPLNRAVVVEALIGVPGENKTPVDITKTYLSNVSATERGIFDPSHLIFTTLPEQPLAIKPGDCSVSLVYGQTDRQEPVVGIIHASRNELAIKLPALAMRHLETEYGCDPSSLRIGVAPSLSKEHHVILAKDVAQHIPDMSIWSKHSSPDENGDIHLDVPGLLVAQFVDADVSPGNIQIYDVDTYDAAASGESFSHRFATMNQSNRVGRYMLAIQIGA